MISPTISWIEVLWTVVAIFGIGASSYVLWDAAGDYKAAKLAGLVGAPAITAKMNLRNEAIRMAVLVIFLLVGLAAMLIPNDPSAFTPPRVTVAIALTSAACLLVWGSFADRRDRQTILAELSHRRASDSD